MFAPLVVHLALLGALAQHPGPSSAVDTCPGSPTDEPPEYEAEGVLVAFGQLIDFDLHPQCAGHEVYSDPETGEVVTEPCFAHALLKIRVTHSIGGGPRGDLLFHMYLPEGPLGPLAAPITKGAIVALAYEVRESINYWSCGRLAPCATKPPYQYMGLDLFRQVKVE